MMFFKCANQSIHQNAGMLAVENIYINKVSKKNNFLEIEMINLSVNHSLSLLFISI